MLRDKELIKTFVVGDTQPKKLLRKVCQWDDGKSIFIQNKGISDKAIGEFVMLQLMLWICQCQPICCCVTECAEIIAKV